MKQRSRRPARRKAMTRGIVLATLVLTGIVLSSSAMAQIKTVARGTALGSTVGQGDSVEGVGSQSLQQAPIGHRQPRPHDLPPGISYDHGKTPAERALDRRLIICRC